MCVCVRERKEKAFWVCKKERERGGRRGVCMCREREEVDVGVCMCKREREYANVCVNV